MNSNQLAVLLLLAKVNAQDFDYADHGSDWPINYPGCGDGNQSPINLLSMSNSRNDYSYYVYGANDDQFEKIYKNQASATIDVIGANPTTKDPENPTGGIVALDEAVNGKSAFKSSIAESVFGAANYFEADSFEFHSPSEHTVDGV